MKNYLVIGLTGQTGAGKSTVCSFAEKEGAAVINADHIAREVMYPGSLCIQKLSEAFGKDIVDDKGCLIRSRLAERAFADREKTELLNRITHPFIIDKTKEYIAAFGNKNYEVVLFLGILLKSCVRSSFYAVFRPMLLFVIFPMVILKLLSNKVKIEKGGK